MSIWDRLTRGNRPKKKIATGPRTLAFAIVPLAAQHAQALVKAGVVSDDADETYFIELLLAYFCLAASFVGRCGRDQRQVDRFCMRMIEALQQYPEEETPLVRSLFSARANVEDSIQFYVLGKTGNESERLEKCRRLLSIDESKWLHFFAVKIHLRVTRRLQIGDGTKEFMTAWFTSVALVVALGKNLLAEIEPSFEAA